MPNIKGKGLKAIANDVADGYVTVNPIFLKPLENEALKSFFHEIMKSQAVIRSERFPHNDTMLIRSRNMRLQRLHTAAMIIKTYARERRIQIL